MGNFKYLYFSVYYNVPVKYFRYSLVRTKVILPLLYE